MPESRAVAAPGPAEVLAAAQERIDYNRRLIEACPDPLIAVAPGGAITDANAAFLSVLGVPREKLINSEFAGWFTEPELAAACVRETFSHGPVRGYPLTLRKPFGQPTHVLCGAAPYRDRQDEIAGIVVIAHDVSQQKQRENELARLQADMALHADELKQRESEIERINELYEVLQACNSQPESYPVIRSAAGELFPEGSGALSISVSRAHQMETVVEWGEDPRMAASFMLDDCWALRRGQMLEVAEPHAPQSCRHFVSAPPGPYICLPLSVRGDLLGLLNLRCAQGEYLNGQKRHLFTMLGEVVKLSLSSLKLRDALRAQAIRDPLTGLFNRNYLNEMLRRELSRSARHHSKLCLAMLDIDGFKTFNDTYSHNAGDILLKALADFFAKKLRASDIVCRYGGDEFVLVLPETDLQQVSERLNRIRAEVKNIQCEYEGRILPPASISIGIAQWPDQAGTDADLIKAADGALYAAKHSGRDQVSVFGSGVPAK